MTRPRAVKIATALLTAQLLLKLATAAFTWPTALVSGLSLIAVSNVLQHPDVDPWTALRPRTSLPLAASGAFAVMALVLIVAATP